MRKIYDAVHGFIRFNELERELIDSAPFQRLHYLHQLGIAYLVYPGATHTRFEHSLGVMELATRIFDRITSKSSYAAKEELAYWRQIIRLAALSHDLGHLPFSHVAEKILLGKQGHEKWTLEILQSGVFDAVFEKLQAAFPQKEVAIDVIKMAIGEEKLSTLTDYPWEFTPWERVMCQIITGDFFGADRIDYLLRDAQCTGVSYGLFDYHQMIEMLCILPVEGENTLELGIEENGIESCEALLLARHFMYKRVYQYSSVKAYSFHLARFMEALALSKKIELGTLDAFLALTENEILTELRRAERDPDAPGHRDALALSDRKKRFKALELTDQVNEGTLWALKKELEIPDEAIAWEVSHDKKRPFGLSFSVLTSRKKILPASRCSDILIHLGSAGWAYVDPLIEEKVRQSI